MQEQFPQQANEELSQPEQTMGELVRDALTELELKLSTIKTVDDVEMHAYSIMDLLPESQENVQKIQDTRKEGGDESELVAKQHSLFSSIKSEIALISDVELEEDRAQRENTEYRQRTQAIFKGEENLDDRELLLKTGLVVEDKEGQPHFEFSKEVFPPHIVEKWDSYIDIVKKHVTIIGRRQLGLGDDVAAIARLDSIRTHAHDAVSASVEEFLQIPEWDFAKCRRFVAKMRDSAIPTIETAEEAVTANAMRRLIIEMEEIVEK